MKGLVNNILLFFIDLYQYSPVEPVTSKVEVIIIKNCTIKLKYLLFHQKYRIL